MYGGERKFGRDLETGRMLENSYFGEVPVTEEMRREFRSLEEEHGGRIPAAEMFGVVRKHQVDDPENPRRDLPREIRLAVADRLKVSEDDLDNVKFYSAVGTPVDHLLGVDAWIEYDDPSREVSAIGTMDVTYRQDKIQEGHKADVVFGELSDINSDEYLDEVEDIARVLADKMKDEIGRGALRAA